MSLLKITDLHVSVSGTPILKGVNLEIKQGEIHALMGPNGSGKSTLAYAMAGHPSYEITQGKIEIDGTDISELDPNERARLGLFLAFQYPVVIPGVKVADFLRHAMSNVRDPERKEGEKLIPMREFRKELREQMTDLGMDPEMARRYLNEGFSGGEKKRMEILQLALLKPKFAVLDETDSGLDSDAVKVVSEGLSRLSGPEMGVLIITHHERLLEFNQPQFTHVMLAGRIVETGDAQLAAELHEHGYTSIRERHPEAAAEEVSETVEPV
ncbi:Fe-S cluster assembly ATPase SufC [Gimesia panareensis]|uniref:Putative ABC transporter ATP-binding protein n=1 Tax=Gimesia panareensis TaxID=2527978 RepID=A0A518FP02_9PLAN|nr:Fe-S cluster assembly ATPase SufC [Gimesia panareensis]QDT25900.1 putative ABC transporter ATP-binding protein [Gimesia panareensis]QDU48837.1 putative ABC transporter ATP-binding protein [Gimesia panareensis]QDV17995.1 putative ABC transporter ATP-binding protein [Gimesia panareensis]